MDFSALNPIMPIVAPMVLGPIAAGITQIAKNAPAIPVNSGNAMVLRATVMMLSIAGALLTAWSTNSLGTLDWQTVLKQVGEVIMIYATAIATYEHSGKPKT